MKKIAYIFILGFIILAATGCSNKMVEMNKNSITYEDIKKHRYIPFKNKKELKNYLKKYVDMIYLKKYLEKNGYMKNEKIQKHLYNKEGYYIANYVKNVKLYPRIQNQITEKNLKTLFDVYTNQRKVAFIRASSNNHDRIVKAKKELLDGKKFEEVARKYSEHEKTAQKGGYWGWVDYRSLPIGPALQVYRTKPGNFTDIIKTEDRKQKNIKYWIFYIYDTREIKAKSGMVYSKAKENLRKRLFAYYSNKYNNQYSNKLENKYNVKYLDKNIEKVTKMKPDSKGWKDIELLEINGNKKNAGDIFTRNEFASYNEDINKIKTKLRGYTQVRTLHLENKKNNYIKDNILRDNALLYSKEAILKIIARMRAENIKLSKEEKKKAKKEYEKENLQANVSLLTVKDKNKYDKVLNMINKRNFNELTKKYSTHPTSRTGGGFGWINLGEYTSYIDKAIKNQKPNSIKGYKVNDNKYAIIFIKGKKEPKLTDDKVQAWGKIKYEKALKTIRKEYKKLISDEVKYNEKKIKHFMDDINPNITN